MDEIDKCEVRCANCHRRKTAKQLGWFAYLGENHPQKVRDHRDAAAGRQALEGSQLWD